MLDSSLQLPNPQTGLTIMSDFWDKRATILKYDKAIYEGKATPPDSSGENAAEGDALFREACQANGFVSFEDMISQFEIEPYFYDLSRGHLASAAIFGVLGTLIAVLTDEKGEFIEDKIHSISDKYVSNGVTNPADYKAGRKHRYFFGHDILNPMQRLPAGYLYKGKDVGGKTLYELCVETYGLDQAGWMKLIAKPLGFASQMLTHYASDLPTPQGLPLPGSSLFTEWEENVINTSGFSARNDLMEALGKEFGTLHLSDLTSTATIAVLVKSYHHITVRKDELSKSAQSILRNQLAVVAYGTGLITQLSLSVAGIERPSAKLNWILTVAFLKNTCSLIKAVDDKHKGVLQCYNASIDRLRDPSVSFDEWIDKL